MLGRERALVSLFLLIRELIPSWGPNLMTSSNPHYLPKAPPPNTITLGVRTSAYEFGWGGHNLVCSFGGSLEFHESQGTSGGDQGNVLFGRRNLQESQTCRVAFIKLDPWTQAGLGTPWNALQHIEVYCTCAFLITFSKGIHHPQNVKSWCLGDWCLKGRLRGIRSGPSSVHHQYREARTRTPVGDILHLAAHPVECPGGALLLTAVR